MDIYETDVQIVLPPRRVSRRNYRHPARLYARAARRARNMSIIDVMLRKINGPADTIQDLISRNIACYLLKSISEKVTK